MGNQQGVIWNQTDFPLQYCLYGPYQELGTYTSKKVINPNVQLSVKQGSITLNGFQDISEFKVNPKYSQSFVEVQPGSYTSTGLYNVEMNKQKISVRLAVGNYVKYLIRDLVITSMNDVRLKFRNNWSIKDLGQFEVKDLVRQNMKSSGLNPEEKIKRSQSRVAYQNYQKQIYFEVLEELKKADKGTKVEQDPPNQNIESPEKVEKTVQTEHSVICDE